MKNLSSILTYLLVTSITSFSFADSKNHQYQDADYNRAVCNILKGNVEVNLEGAGRADCVSNDFAVETEFADLWKQGIEQATRYGKGAKKKALLALIIENDQELFYAKSAEDFAQKNKLGLEIRKFKLSDLRAHLPQKQTCAKLSNSGICHLVNTGSYANTSKFRPFDSFHDCLKYGRLPGNVGIQKLQINAKKAFEDGQCKDSKIY